ncbi:MAG: FeoA family protein [Dysosmobacter sp.]
MADTLDTLPAGRWAAIRAVTHSQRQRLLELGFIPGTIVRAGCRSVPWVIRWPMRCWMPSLPCRCDARCVHITVL